MRNHQIIVGIEFARATDQNGGKIMFECSLGASEGRRARSAAESPESLSREADEIGT